MRIFLGCIFAVVAAWQTLAAEPNTFRDCADCPEMVVVPAS